MKKEATCFSQTFVPLFQPTKRHNPQYLNPYKYLCENLEFRNGDIFEVRGPYGSHLDNPGVWFINTTKRGLFISLFMAYLTTDSIA
jgi:hypothetical protein